MNNENIQKHPEPTDQSAKFSTMLTGWQVRALLLLFALTVGSTWVWANLGPWHRPSLVIFAALIISGSVVCVSFRSTRAWLGRMDWRIGAILLVTAVSVAVTLLGFDFGLDSETTSYRFLHDVFAGWVSGIAFFGLVGLVIAIVSLVRPEEEGFDSRARILFRGQTGKHIEYIVARIREIFEQYASQVIDTITVEDVQTDGTGKRKIFVRTEMTSTICGYIDDITSTYQSKIELAEATPSPDPNRPNRLAFLHVGERNWGGQVFNADSICVPFNAVIEPGHTCFIRYGIEFWIQEHEEPNTFEPARYTRTLAVRMRNHLTGSQEVHVKIQKAERTEELVLGPGSETTIYEGRDLLPGKQIYEYRLSVQPTQQPS